MPKKKVKAGVTQGSDSAKEEIVETTETVTTETKEETAEVVTPTANAAELTEKEVVEPTANAAEEEKAPKKGTIVEVASGDEERRVKVKALVYHKCNIAMKSIAIEKGKEYKMPRSMAIVLQGSNKVVVVA